MHRYQDPKLRRRVTRLATKQLGRRAIAAKLGISTWTVRAILVPGFVEAERARMRLVDAARASRWEDDPNYREYQTDYGKRPERLAQARATMTRLRKQKKLPVE